MKVALYLRRSTTDQQPDSLEAQEELLRRFAALHQHEVVAVFADSSSGRRIEGRAAFQQLIEEVKQGPRFAAILVRDISRWSRAENLDEAAFYEWICKSRGVEVLYVDDNLGPEGTAYGQLMKSLKRYAAAEFSRERKAMVQQSHARLVRLGFWVIGSSPYGMKRVRCDGNGVILGELRPGDRKALANERVKLAPGDPTRVTVVQRMFREYADGRSLKEIAQGLNTDGIPSAAGSRWEASAIGYNLANEAYAGSIVYRIVDGDESLGEPSEWSPNIREVRCDNAHPAIIPRDLWDAVCTRLRKKSWHRSDADIAEELSALRNTWRQETQIQHSTVGLIRQGYGASDVAVVGDTLIASIANVRAQLESAFHVIDFEGGLLLDHLLHLKFIASLPHSGFGHLHWSFEFTGDEREDAFIGLGFSPPEPIEHVETYLFRARHGRVRRVVQPLLNAESSQNCARIRSFEELVRLLNHSIRYRTTRAETTFLATARSMEKLNLKEVAKELGWSYDAVRTLYRKLEARGELMPPLENGHLGKRITVVCPHCLGTRSLSPKAVVSLKTEVCFECLHRPPVSIPNRLVAECPSCGARRLFRPSDVAARSNGLDSLCGRCQRLKNCSEANVRRGYVR